MSTEPLGFDPTQTQWEYISSEAVVNVIISNTGEGKTYASVIAMIYHAKRCKRPITCAIVRDTHENIKLSTARSIIEILGQYARFRNDFKQLTIYSNPRVEVDLFGIDDLGSLSKLQGPEYALIWLEEPAPMADKVNAGLSEEVFNAALVRATRQRGTFGRLQVSMNPADQEHWTYRRFIEEADIDPDNPLITKKVFQIPYGENVHAKEESRQAVKSAYKDDPASYMRYVLGGFAPVYRGKKVTPGYNPTMHRSPESLAPARGLVGFRAWDGWHNPTCLMGQITHTGRLIYLNTLRLEGGDIRALIQAQVVPMMNSPRWRDKCKAWRDVGDFSLKTPDQSNVQESAARVIERELGGVFEPGPHKWDIMKQGLVRVFNMNIMGMPAVYLCHTNTLLHKALDGGWHYKTDNSGNIISVLPEKDEISHVGDGFANSVNVLLPVHEHKEHKEVYRRHNARAKKRNTTYAVGGNR